MVFIMLMLTAVDSGPLAYGICQTGCNSLVVACYAAAGAFRNLLPTFYFAVLKF